jgi:alkylated DNA repair dioxygenase AlkB
MEMSVVTYCNDERGLLYSVSNVMPPEYCEMSMEELMRIPLPERPEIVVWGKTVRQSRDVGFFSDEAQGYFYSGKMASASPLTPTLKYFLDRVNTLLGASLNGILMNRYHNGSDSIGAHSDDESRLDSTMVVTLAFGATRTFRIRDKRTKEIVYDIPHVPGTAIVMGGAFQENYTHEIPKCAISKCSCPRISLTFRRHV